MSSIHFDITADNANFINSINESINRVKVAERTMGDMLDQAARTAAAAHSFTELSSSVGKVGDALRGADFGTAEEKVRTLSNAIQQNETVIANSTKTVEKWKEDLAAAFAAGDTQLADAISADIERELASMQQLTTETANYKAALDAVLALQGMSGQGEPVLRLYKNETDLQQVEVLRQKIQDTAAEIANVGAQGGDTTALTVQLTALRDELNECETKAATAAAALGTELGGKAVEAQQSLHALNTAIKQQQTVIDKLAAATAAAKTEYDNLKASNDADTDAVEAAAAAYSTLSAQLAEANSQMAALQGEQRSAQTEWQNVSREIDTHDSAIVKLLGGYDNYKNILGQLPAPLQSVIVGIQGMTGAARAFIATPIGLILAAVALALTAVHKWLTKTVEGQKALAAITGFVNGVMGQLMKAVVAVGEALYKAFTDPKKAVKDLWEAIKQNLVNRVKSVVVIVQAAMKTLSAVLDRDWDSAAQGVKQLNDGYIQLATGIEHATDKMRGMGKEMANNAKAMRDISVERNELEREYSLWQIEKQGLEKKKATAQGRIYNSSLTAEERQAAMQEWEKYTRKIYEREKYFADKRAELQERENETSPTGNADEFKLNELRAQSAALDAQFEQQKASMQRRANAIENASQKAATALQTIAETEEALTVANQKRQLDIMDDGLKKKLAKIDYEYNAEIAAIKKNAAKLKKANEDANITDTNENGLTAAQQAAINEATRLAAATRTAATAEAYQAETAAMRQYLAQYGTYQEQKLAIAEEYAEKIRKAATEGERLTLERQRDSALSKLDLEHLKENIDWETIFNDIDVLSLEYLEKLKEQLQDALKAGTIQAEDAKTISEQIQRINEAIVEKQKEWRANFGLVIPELEEIRRREREALEAEEAKNLAQEKLNAALIREKRIRQDIVKLANGKAIAIEETDVTTGNQNSIFALFQDAKEDTEGLSNLFSQLAEAESNTATSTTALANASSTAAIKTQAAAGGMASTVAIIDKIIHTVNDNIQSANSLFEKIGVANTQFGEGFASFAESSQYATSAWESLKSGNAMGVIDGVVGSIQTLGKSFESWFGFSFNNSNSAEVAKITARLTESNEALRRAIDKLKDRITDSYGGAKSITAGQEALAAQKQVNSQTMEILRAQMGYHSAHHSNAYYWGLSNKDYQSINATLAQYATNEGKTASRVYSLADIYKLTPEEMDYIRTFNIDMWNKMLDQGKYDKSEYWEQFADLAGEIEEIENALKETLTQTSFDSLRSSFVDALMDMDASAEDFADDFSEYMMRAVLNAKIADMLDSELDKFYDSWADATESGNALTETEINRLNEQWQDIVNRGIAIRDQAAAITGYDSTASTSQSASTKGFQSMGQETADELNGRFTALQIVGEKIASLSESTFAKITEMAAVQVAGNTTLTEMRNLMISSNSFLEDIARYSKKSYTEFGSCLEEIRTNTKALRQ